MHATKICIIGLGYVGMPLAQLFSKKYETTGFDILTKTNNNFKCTTLIDDIKDCNVYIVAVPTPVDQNNNPDLEPLRLASRTVGKVISKNDVVIYESTVYPGVTEEVCLPIIENVSQLKLNRDFFAGYSPERINPGDDLHTIEKIIKITSGSTPETADFVDLLYNSVLTNGTYKAPSIKIAEAAKIIENVQRDVNIAFINEAAKIFNAMGIDTHDVLEAASTKWNFINFKPGLVGGHCIGIDSFYLIHKAIANGVVPEMTISARKTNNSMAVYVAEQLIKCMNKKAVTVKNADILILGFTFKENCSDTRNTKIFDIYKTLKEYTENIIIFDPHVDVQNIKDEYNIEISNQLPERKFDAIIDCVGHQEFSNLDILSLKKSRNSVIYDIKGLLDRNIIDKRL